MTGERISALEGIGESVRPERERDGKASPDRERPSPEASAPPSPDREIRAGFVPGQGAGARAAGACQGAGYGSGAMIRCLRGAIWQSIPSEGAYIANLGNVA